MALRKLKLSSMQEEFKNQIEEIYSDIVKGRTDGYQELVNSEINNLNFQLLQKLIAKPLSELTEEDLITIGLERTSDKNFKLIYNYRDLNNVKKYITITDTCFELREFMLEKTKDIHTTEELLDELLIKWKLKM